MDIRRAVDPNALASAMTIGAASLTGTCLGETITLHPGDGPASQVQDAIAAAEDGDVIRLAAGTWIWGVDLGPLDLLGKTITLEGEAGGETVVALEFKPESVPAIVISSGEDEACRIRHLQFDGAGGATGNVVQVVASSPTIESCDFIRMNAVDHPLVSVADGGLRVQDCGFTENLLDAPALITASRAALEIEDCWFVDCGRYSTIVADDSTLQVDSCLFERTIGGPATRGDAIGLSDCCGTIVDSTFRGLLGDWLFPEASGVSIVTGDAPREDFCLSVSGCRFEDLEYRSQGSALGSSVPIVVVESDFRECSAAGASGGAIDLFRGGVVAACDFTGCFASKGGAVAGRGSTVVWACSFQGNRGTKGGAVFSTNDRLIVLDSDFLANTAQDGGAIWTSLNDRAEIEVETPVALYGCVFEANHSFQAGPAVFFGYEIGQALVERCRFLANLDSNGNPEAFGHPDEDEDWDRYEVLVGESLFCPDLWTSRRYMTDLGGNLIDIRCPGDEIDSVLVVTDGRPLVWWYNDFFGWIRRQVDGNQIHLFDPDTGGMERYFSTGGDWTVAPRIDAFTRVDERRLLMSFASQGRPDDLEGAPDGAVTGADILLFTATEFGEITEGRWSFHFDGSDVGLSGTRGNIDALAIEPDGSLLISVTGTIQLEGIGQVDDADIVRFRPESLGSETRGTWERFIDTGYSGFTGAGEDVDALALIETSSDRTDFAISSTGPFSVGSLSAADEDVLEFTWYPGLETVPSSGISVLFDGLDDLGYSIPRADVTGLEWIGAW